MPSSKHHRFSPEEYVIREEEQLSDIDRVVKSGEAPERLVADYEYRELHSKGKVDFRQAFEYSSGGHAHRAKKGKVTGFVVNPLVIDPEAYEREQRRQLEEKVASHVRELEEKVIREAHEEGYREGYEKGRLEAIEEFRKETAEKLQAFESLVNRLEEAKEELFSANERFIVELAYQSAKRIVLRELKDDPDYVIRLCGEVIEKTGLRENIRVRISPKDLGTLQTLKEELVRRFGELKNLNIEPSSEVESGGCIVETDWSRIDASLKSQFLRLHENLVNSDGETE